MACGRTQDVLRGRPKSFSCQDLQPARSVSAASLLQHNHFSKAMIYLVLMGQPLMWSAMSPSGSDMQGLGQYGMQNGAGPQQGYSAPMQQPQQQGKPPLAPRQAVHHMLAVSCLMLPWVCVRLRKSLPALSLSLSVHSAHVPYSLQVGTMLQPSQAIAGQATNRAHRRSSASLSSSTGSSSTVRGMCINRLEDTDLLGCDRHLLACNKPVRLVIQ